MKSCLMTIVNKLSIFRKNECFIKLHNLKHTLSAANKGAIGTRFIKKPDENKAKMISKTVHKVYNDTKDKMGLGKQK